jgi:hypothetical protein
MTPILAALCLLTPPQNPNWPAVSSPLFVINGIDEAGMANLQHARIGEKAGVTSIGKPRTGAGGSWASLLLPSGTQQWRSLQIAFTYSSDGPVASFGGIELSVKKGYLWEGKIGANSKIAPVSPGDLTDVQIVRQQRTVHFYVNGKANGQPLAIAEQSYPVEVGNDPFKGTIVGVAAYARELSTDELDTNDKAVHEHAKPLFADTLKVTVEGQMTAFTPIPELERIRPYRSALLAEEYKVIRIVSGRNSSIKPGMKIRIFRYGIKAGEKTAVKDAKVGGRATMVIQGYDSDPKFGREFQVNDLEPDITIPQFVEVTPIN